jgi:acid stress-induced BolA-like protein IbaG/YrbA
MTTQEKVRRVLERLGLSAPAIDVQPSDGHRIVAEVVSDSFEGMPEEDRQELVWTELGKQLDPREQAQVEYVLTNAPSERDPAEAH